MLTSFAVIAEGVADVFALCDLEKPDIGLLSDEFLEDVRQMPEKNLAVELLEKLLKDNIKAKTRNNIVREKKYADRLQDILRKYNNRASLSTMPRKFTVILAESQPF